MIAWAHQFAWEIPASKSPRLTDLKDSINYNEIFQQLMHLDLYIYMPSHFILDSKLGKYAEIYQDNKVNVGFTQASREQGIRRLMAINLMKRMESSVYSFNLTLQRICKLIDDTIQSIDAYDKSASTTLNLTDISNLDQLDADDQSEGDIFTIGRKVKIEIGDMDYVSWRRSLAKDLETLQLLIFMVGDITPEKVRILQDADDIYMTLMREWGLYDKIWQAGVILLPIRSVGVMGDERTYENAVALRAVTSTDAMTADWAQLPYEFLAKVSNEIINKVKGVNRVVYDISSKPPATIEWE